LNNYKTIINLLTGKSIENRCTY